MTSNHEHSQDVFIQPDGSKEYRDPWEVTTDESLNSKHSGGVCVHASSTFEIGLGGHLSGSLSLQSRSTGRIVGKHSGSLHVADGAVAEISGDQSGSVHVDQGGLVKVHPGGKLAGSLHGAGLIENRGTRGGSVHMSGGEIRDVDGGSEKQPTRRPDGANHYSW